MKPSYIAAILLSICFLPLAHAGGGPQNVLVLVNDSSPDSLAVGAHYAKARGLHPRNVLHLRTATKLEIPFAQYDEEIRGPILRYLRESGLAPQIDYLVATQGFPIRLTLPGDKQRHLSLCAALQALDTDLEMIPTLSNGIRRNPYLDANRAFSHELVLGGERAHIYLATMLIGLNKKDAMALVDRSLQADNNPPPPGLFLFQDAQANAVGRNSQYDKAVEMIMDKGFRAKHIPAGVKALKDRAALISWFSGGSYSKLTRAGINAMKFHPGAMVDMLQSFGAVPANFDPEMKKKKQVPITWAVEAGATGVHGAVAEPFTVAFPSARTPLLYLEGFNLAESFFLCIPTFWWQNLLIGDPLCAPYAKKPQFTSGLAALGTKPVSGKVTIAAKGENIARFELYRDGLRVARASAGTPLVWDTTALVDGPTLIRLVAISAGPAATQSWVEKKITIFNPELRVLGMKIEGGKQVAGPQDALVVRLSREPALPIPGGTITVKGPGGKPVAITIKAGKQPNILRLVPSRPLTPSSAYEVRIKPTLRDGKGATLAKEFRGGFHTTAARFVIFAPPSLKAGEKCLLTIKAMATTDTDAAVDTNYQGRIKLTISDPKADLPPRDWMEEGCLKLSLRLSTTGEFEIRASDQATGLSATTKIKVLPGPFHKIHVDVPKEWPAGHALAATLSGRDRFGNVTPDSSPDLQVYIGNDGPYMARLGPANQGSKVILVPCPWEVGEQEIIVRSGREKLCTAKLQLTTGGLRRWLRLGSFGPQKGKRLLPPKPPRNAPGPGVVWADTAWMEETTRETPAKLHWFWDNRTGWVATGLMATEKTTITIRLGATQADFGLYLDGKELATTPQTKEFITGAITETRTLNPGYHWLGLAITKHNGAKPQFTLELSGERRGSPPRGVCFFLRDPYNLPERFFVSGYVRSGSHGLANLKVELITEEGKKKRTKTGPHGFYFFPKVEAGLYRVRPIVPGRPCMPAERSIFLHDDHSGGQDFSAIDKVFPKVKIQAPKRRTKARRNLVVRATASDDLGVEYVYFQIDGETVGDKDYSGPYNTTLPIHKLRSGPHQLAVIARDYAGNETKKTVTFMVK